MRDQIASKDRKPRKAAGTAWAGILAVAALGLACASQPPPTDAGPSYHQQISRWNGDTEANLVTAWGVPAKTHVLANGGRIIEYKQDASVGPCTTRFTLDGTGRIVRWWYTGKDCRAPKNGGA